jgi:hypothetical protein
MSRSTDGYFKYWDGGDLLRKVTQDLLQTEFSPQPVAEGASWKPRGQFAYFRDRALKDLELSGADLRFRNLGASRRQIVRLRDVAIRFLAHRPSRRRHCQRRTHCARAQATTPLRPVLHISLLLDPATHHVAWLHRSQTIDNKLTLASPYDDGDSSGNDPADPNDADDPENPMPDMSSMRSDNPGRYPFMTFHFQEEARARLLPNEHSVEWLAALKRFEATPDPESGTAPVPVTKTLLPNPMILAAKPAVVKRSTRLVVDSETLVATPAGFTRYEKGLCRDAWFCATVSVALPGDVQVSDDTPLRTVYLAHRGDKVVSISVGPALDRRSQGSPMTKNLESKPRTISTIMSGWRRSPESEPTHSAPRSTATPA